ncbi:MAG: MFS transporter [Ardenticatenaceae bacterium]|nr:MFS transporter [Ardenticatenaceae bacterium]
MRPNNSVLFYGWIIALVSAFSLAVGGASRFSFGLFYVSILDEFSWSHAATAVAATAGALIYGFTAPAIGAVTDAFGPRIILPIGAVALGLGCLLASQVRSNTQLYVAYGIISLGTGAFSFAPQVAVISHWFQARRATASGVMFAGYGLGTLILVPLIQVLISTYSWRTAFVIFGLFSMITLIPLTAVLMRHRPQEMGLEPDGEGGHLLEGSERRKWLGLLTDNPGPILVVNQKWAACNWTLRHAAGTGRFWLVALGNGCVGITIYILTVHQAAHMVSVGYNALFAASIIGVWGLVRAGGSLFGGVMSDHWGREQSYTLSVSLSILGILILLAVSDPTRPWMLYLYAILLGLGTGISTPTGGALVADIFQGSSIATILGALEMFLGLGGAIGSWLGGYIFDVSTSYQLGFIIAIASLGVSCLAFWGAAPRRIRMVGQAARVRAPLER